MTANKIYLGKGKSVGEFDMVNFSICVSDIPKDKIFEYEGKKYLKLTIARMKQPDKFGKEYTIYLDEYKPVEENHKDPF